MKATTTTNSLLKASIVILLVTVLLLIVSYFLSMVIGLALFFTPAGIDFSLGKVQPPLMLFFLFGFYSPFALSRGTFFLFLWSVFVLCFLAAWRLRESFHKVVSKAFSRPFEKLFNNWLFTMPIVASALLFAVSLIIAVQDLFGVPTGTLPAPKTDAETFNFYLSLTYAPIIEEIAFRISPIGTFLLARLFLVPRDGNTASQSLMQRLKLFFASFLYPDKAKRMVGGVKNVTANGVWGGISRGEWMMLMFTSLAFAIAHIISGIGWEFGKITSTFVQGFVFGLVYLVYGIQAPILLHWFFNYYFYSLQLGAQYLSSSFDFFIWIEYLTLLLGLVFIVGFAYFGLKRMLPRKTAPSESTGVAAEPELL